MPRPRSLFLILVVALLAVFLAACVRTESDDSVAGGQPEPTPDPTETEVVEPDPTPSPDEGEDRSWYEELTTDKTYPEDATGENLMELAEDEETFQELWDRFQLGEADRPEIDWDNQIVLFAGTGESGSCPLVLTSIDFDEEERFITIAAEQDVPSGAMCTMDWTPRVFVIAFDRDHLGEGELRALLYDPEFDQDIVPEDGTVIR